MGTLVLKHVIETLDQYEPDDVAYVYKGVEIAEEAEVAIVPYQMTKTCTPPGMVYFLEIGVMREVLEDTAAQVDHELSLRQKIRALRYYSKNDAYIDVEDLEDN